MINALIVYAIFMWTSTLAFATFGIVRFAGRTSWTWKVVARVAAIVLTAPVSIPAILLYIYAVSKISFRQPGN